MNNDTYRQKIETFLTENQFLALPKDPRSRDSVVGITTRYGLESSGIESRRGEIFRTRPDRLWGPSNLQYNGYRVFSG